MMKLMILANMFASIGYTMLFIMSFINEYNPTLRSQREVHLPIPSIESVKSNPISVSKSYI
jgi:hypothetical protein